MATERRQAAEMDLTDAVSQDAVTVFDVKHCRLTV